jgi:transposase
MLRSKAYRALAVKHVALDRLLAGRADCPARVGLDISKDEVRAVLRWPDGQFERPWRSANPGQVRELTELLRQLAQGRDLVVALEPTGTYGDALRQALHDAGVLVHRVSPKVAHDYAEVFDGVPSQHDGKDAAVVAELAATGKSVAWPFGRRAEDQEMAYWVDRLDQQRRGLAMSYGRLEGLLARHWPEVTSLLPVRSGVLLRCLERYGGPAGLAGDDAALGRLRRWGGPLLTEAQAQAVLAAAATSVGVRAAEFDVRRLQEQAAQARQARRDMGVCRRRLAELAAGNDVIAAQARAVGEATACVLWVQVGDPRAYSCAAAYRKAMGLNLTERSSGRWQGGLHISRRGPGEARRWLYYAALRLVRRAGVRSWYEAKKSRDGGRAGRALVGVARKLALALYRVGTSGEPFEAQRLFAAAGN